MHCVSLSHGGYGRDDLVAVGEVAQQLAASIHGWLLREELEAEARHRATLARIGRHVSSGEDLRETLRILSEEIALVIPYDRFSVTLAPRDSRELTVADRPRAELAFASGVTVAGYTPDEALKIDDAILEFYGGEYQLVRDLTDAQEIPTKVRPFTRNYADVGLRSHIHSLVWRQDAALGTVSLWHKTPNAYSPEDLTFLDELVAHIGAAVEKSILLDNSRSLGVRLASVSDRRELVSRIGRLAAEGSDLDATLERVSIELARVIPHDRFSLALWRNDTETDHGPTPSRWSVNFSNGITVPDRDHGSSVEFQQETREFSRNHPLVHDLLDHNEIPESLRSFTETYTQVGLRSHIHSYVYSEGQRVGVLSLWSCTPDSFNDTHVELLDDVLSQVGAIVQKLILLEESNSLAKQLQIANEQQAILAELGRIVTTSRTLAEARSQISEQMNRLFDMDFWAIRMFDKSRKYTDTVLRDGVPEALSYTTEAGHLIPVEHTVTDLIARTGCGIMADAARLEELRDEGFIVPPAEELLGVPLMVGDICVGAMFTGCLKARGCDGSHLALAQRVADQLAPILENSRLLDEALRLSEEQAALAELGRLVTTSQDIFTARGEITRLVSRILPVDFWSIRILDRETDTVSTLLRDGHPQTMDPPSEPGLNMPASKTITRGVVDSREGLIVDRKKLEELRDSGVNIADARVCLVVPLISGDNCFGSIVLGAVDDRSYTEADLSLAQRIADHIAPAIENRRLLQQALRLSEQRRVLAELGRLIAGTANVDSIKDPVTASLRQLFDLDYWAIRVVDHEHQTVSTLCRDGDPEILGNHPEPARNSPLARTITSRTVERREGMFASRDDFERLAADGYDVTVPINSFMSLPLIAGEGVVGSMFISSHNPNAYDDVTLGLAQTVADHMAPMIENNRLLEEANELSIQLEKIASIGRAISECRTVDDVRDRVTRELMELLNVDRWGVTLIDADRNTVDLVLDDQQADPDYGQFPASNQFLPIPLEGSMTAELVATRKCFTFNMENKDELLQRFPVTDPRFLKGSFLGAPLIVSGTPIGALFVNSWSGKTFSSRDMTLAQALADQIAPALENTRLLQQATELSEHLEQIAAISKEVSESHSLDDVQNRITERFSSLMDVDRWAVNLIDREEQVIRMVMYGRIMRDGRYVLPVGRFMQEYRGTLTEHVAITREPFVRNDSLAQRMLEEFPGTDPDFSVDSILGVPLVVADEVIGVLFVNSSSEKGFTDRDVRVMTSIADHIAPALENNRLLERAVNLSEEQATLAEIGRVVASSRSLDDAQNRLTPLIDRLFPADFWAVRLVDSKKARVDNMLRTSDRRELWPGELQNDGRVPFEKTLTKIVLDANEVLSATNEQLQEYRKHGVVVPSVEAWAGAPLIVGNRRIGAFMVGSHGPFEYTERHRRLVGAVATHIAGSVENNRLLEEQMRLASQLESISAIGRVISESPSLEQAQHQITERLSTLINVDRWNVCLVDQDAGTRTLPLQGRAVTDDGLGDQLTPGPRPLAGSAVEHVVRNREGLILNSIDAEGVERWFPGATQGLPFGSVIAVPLIVADSAIGALQVVAREGQTYENEDLELVQTIADHIGGAVHNSYLLGRAREDAERREALVEIARIVSEDRDFESMARELARHLVEFLPVKSCSVWTVDPDSGTGFVISVAGDDIRLLHPRESQIWADEELEYLRARPRCPVTRVEDVEARRGEFKDVPEGFIRSTKQLAQNGVSEVLAVNLSSGERLAGTIMLTSPDPDTFTADHIEFGNQVSVLVSNAMESGFLRASLEERIKIRTAELETAVEEIESFSYSVSHDLRAPLRAAEGFARILEEDYRAELPDGAKRYIDLIARATGSMGELIEDLLDLARVSRKELKRTEVDVASVVADAMQYLPSDYKRRAIDGNQVEVAEMPVDDADPSLLRHVFVNLISNALKFSEESPDPKVRVFADKEGNATTYYVSDNGVGFDMKYADRIFGVFERLHTSEEFEGTGVGLAIVKRLVERHGGSIGCSATPGQGACFWFTLHEE